MATKTKDYIVDLSEGSAVTLSKDDKFTALNTNQPITDDTKVTSAVLGSDLVITFAANAYAGSSAKTVTIKDYFSSNYAVKSSIKSIYLSDGKPHTIGSDDFDVTMGAWTYNAHGKGQTLTGSNFDDTITTVGYTVDPKKTLTINAGKGNDTITGSTGKDVINAGDGNDTINVTTGDDKLTGGKGTNRYVFNAAGNNGNDTITLTRDENAVINLGATTTTAANLAARLSFDKQNNLLVDLNGDGTEILTIKGFKSTDTTGANGTVKVVTSDGQTINLKTSENETTPGHIALFAQSVAAGDYKATTSTINGKWYSDDINASDVTSAKLNINAGEGDNVITGSAGADTVRAGKGDDTVTATTGNDTYTLGAGANKITYTAGKGNDVINLTKGETLTLDISAIGGINNLATVQGALSFNKNDLVITLSPTDSITIKNFKSTDTTGTTGGVILKTTDGALGFHFVDLKASTFDGVYSALLETSMLKGNLDAKATSVNGTWVNDVIDATGVTSAKLNINAGEGDNTITGSAGADTVRAGKGNDFVAATAGKDTYTLGAGSNQYTVAAYVAGERDTINLTKGETLVIQTGTTTASSGVKYDLENNDLVISSTLNAFKTVVIKNFKSNLNGDVYLSTTDNHVSVDQLTGVLTPDFGTAVNLRTSQLFAAIGAPAKGAVVNGTKLSDTVDLSAAPVTNVKTNAGYTINTMDGNDVITGSAFNDKITAGAGANTIMIKVDGAVGSLGDDVITLTKGEQLTLQLDNAGHNTDMTAGGTLKFTEQKISGKDLVITVYNSTATHNATTLLGTLTVKNYASRDVQDNHTATVADTSSFIIADQSANTLDLKADLINVVVDKANLTGGWLNENYDASGYTPVNHKGVTINAGAGNDTITGSAGDDTITGGAGTNTYIYNAGGGEDTINLTKNEQLTLVYKLAGTTADTIANFTVVQKGQDIIISKGQDKITIKNANNMNLADVVKIEIRQSDNTLNDTQYFIDKIGVNPLYSFAVTGTAASATKGATITGTNLDQTITGTTLNDTIKAVDGTNIIDGLGGNDAITSGKGADSFVFGDNYGTTTISNSDAHDTIEFKAGSGIANNTALTDGTIKYFKSGNDLQIKYPGVAVGSKESTIVLKNWYTASDRVDVLKAINGDEIHISEQLAGAGTNFNGSGTIKGTDGKDFIEGSDKNDTIMALAGNDTITPHKGKDTITGGEGTNTIELEAEDGEKIINLTAGETLNVHYTDLTLTKAAIVAAMDDALSGNDLILSRANGDKITFKNLATAGAAAVNLTVTGSDGNLAVPELLTAVYNRVGNNIKGTNLNENITGTPNADTITTAAGTDTVTALAGDDKITVDGTGAKTINIGIDDGNDTITLNNATAGVIVDFNYVGAAITKAEIVNGTDLVLTTPTSGAKPKTTTIKNYVANAANVVLKENSVVAAPVLEVRASGTTFKGTDLNELFDGSDKADTMTVAGGNDTINPGEGNDIININGAGTKNIAINKSEGNDTIVITNYTANTVITFDNNVAGTYSKLELVKASNNKDLEIQRTYTADGKMEVTTIKNYFTDINIDPTKITIKWNNENAGAGKTLDLVQDGIAITGVEHKANTLVGTIRDDKITGKDLVDTITTGAGNDTIIPGASDDKITINGAGTKTITIGKADENDTISFSGDALKKDVPTNKTVLNYTGTTPAISYELVNGTDLAITSTVETVEKETLVKGYVDKNGDVAVNLDVQKNGVAYAISGVEVRANGTKYVGSNMGEIFNGKADTNETFTTAAGADTINANSGNDTININGIGAKTINIGVDDGNDTIVFSGAALKSAPTPNVDDTTIVFTAATTVDHYYVSGNDLIIESHETADPENTKTTTVKNLFKNGVIDANLVVKIAAADQDYTSHLEVEPKGTTYTGTSNVETFNGTPANETFITGGGADIVNPAGGNDTVKITGTAADTVTVNVLRADGDDTIVLSNLAATAYVKYTDATADDLAYTKSGNDLVINRTWIAGDVKEQKTTIKDFFKDPANIPNVTIKQQAAADINVTTLVTTGAGHVSFVGAVDKANTMVGSFTNDEFTGSTKVDTITTGAGNDIINAAGDKDIINVTGTGTKDININQGEAGDTINMKLANGTDAAATTLDVDFTATAGWAYSDQKFVKNGNNLEVTTTASKLGSDDVVETTKIVDYFKYDTNQDATKVAGLTVNAVSDVNVKTALTTQALLTIDKSAATAKQTINATNYGDIILGGTKDDTITTGAGVDVVTAGAGNDTITVNGDGVKTFHIKRADGDDTIVATANSEALQINFGTKDAATVEGWNTPEYSASLDGKDLIISVTRPAVPASELPAATQKVTVKGFFDVPALLADGAIKLSTNNGASYTIDVSNAVTTTGVTVRLADYAVGDKGVTYHGTAYIDTVIGSNNDDVIYTGDRADDITGGRGNDSIIIDADSVAAKTIRIDKGDGNDTLTIADDVALANSPSVVVTGAGARTYEYEKAGDDLIITRKYSAVADGTTTLKDYFKSTDVKYQALEWDGTALNADGRLNNGTVNVTEVVKDGNATYAGTKFADRIVGSDTKVDVVSGLAAGNDALTLGKGDAEISVLTTDGGTKTVNIDRKDGANTTTIKLENGAQGAVIDLVVADAQYSAVLGYTDPDVSYVRAGRDLSITFTHAAVGEPYNAPEVAQTVVVENYFNEDADTVQTAGMIKYNLPVGGAKIVNADFTADNFTVSDGETEEGVKTINGTTYAEKIVGSSGNDVITTNAGNDIVESGKGEDIVTFGAAGNKTVVLGRNTDADTVVVADTGDFAGEGITAATKLTVDFGRFVAATDEMNFERDGDNLVISTSYDTFASLAAGENQITIENYFKTGMAAKTYYTYLDDTSAVQSGSMSALIGTAKIAYETSVGNDDVDLSAYAYDATVAVTSTAAHTITASDNDDKYTLAVGTEETASTGMTLNAGDGNDVISATLAKTGSSVTLNGEAGNDTIEVTTVTGSTATLAGGAGNDTYRVKGDGSATITETAGQNTFILKGNATITNTGSAAGDNDHYELHKGTVEVVSDANGADHYTVAAYEEVTTALTVTAETAGNDIYTLGGTKTASLTVSADNAGNDSYQLTNDNGTMTISDNGDGTLYGDNTVDDSYTVSGGTMTVTVDNAGKDVYNATGGTLVVTADNQGTDTYRIMFGAHATINDYGNQADEYNVSGSDTVATIHDNGAAGSQDVYKISNGTVSITDENEADTYTITGGNVTIDDKLDDADTYTIAKDATVSIKDGSVSSSTNTLKISDAASTDIAVKLLFSSNAGADTAYTVKMIVDGNEDTDGAVTIDTGITLQKTDGNMSAKTMSPKFDYKDKSNVTLTNAEMNALIQAVTSWTSGENEMAFGDLFDGENKTTVSEAVAVVDTSSWHA